MLLARNPKRFLGVSRQTISNGTGWKHRGHGLPFRNSPSCRVTFLAEPGRSLAQHKRKSRRVLPLAPVNGGPPRTSSIHTDGEWVASTWPPSIISSNARNIAAADAVSAWREVGADDGNRPHVTLSYRCGITRYVLACDLRAEFVLNVMTRQGHVDCRSAALVQTALEPAWSWAC